MSLTDKQIEIAANELFLAEKNRVQIPLLSRRFNLINMKDAYAIQDNLVKKKLASGLKIKGWKIGLTSKAMQDALKINIPDSGVLFDNMFFENDAEIPLKRFIQTRIEAEIAFVFKKELTGKNISEEWN